MRNELCELLQDLPLVGTIKNEGGQKERSSGREKERALSFSSPDRLNELINIPTKAEQISVIIAKFRLGPKMRTSRQTQLDKTGLSWSFKTEYYWPR